MALVMSKEALAFIEQWAAADREAKKCQHEWMEYIIDCAKADMIWPGYVINIAKHYKEKLQELDRAENRLRSATLDALSKCYREG